MILNYSTTISAEKTLMEIQKCLVTHGAKKIVVDYDISQNPCAVTFAMDINGILTPYSLPINAKPILSILNDSKIPTKLKTNDQAMRVGLRIILSWVKAQMAIVETNMVDIGEVFFPYLVLNNGETTYQFLKKDNYKMIQQ